MAVLRLFAAARVAAGTGREIVAGSTVGEVLAAADLRFGPEFTEVARHCAVWRNGVAATPDELVEPDDEVALLPPVSGGAVGRTAG